MTNRLRGIIPEFPGGLTAELLKQAKTNSSTPKRAQIPRSKSVDSPKQQPTTPVAKQDSVPLDLASTSTPKRLKKLIDQKRRTLRQKVRSFARKRYQAQEQELFFQDFKKVFEMTTVLVNKEPMPKYVSQLASKEVQAFMERYELWADQQGYNDEKKKSHLPMAMLNSVAQQYFVIHNAILSSNAVSWTAFKTAFLRECPMEAEDSMGIMDIMAITQAKGEKASLFLQKIRYYYSDHWRSLPEKEIVQAMVRQLNINTRRYVQCRGMPATYADLAHMVRDYEERGGTKDLDEFTTVKQEVPISLVSEDQDKWKKMESKLDKLTSQMNFLSTNSRGSYRGNSRGRGNYRNHGQRHFNSRQNGNGNNGRNRNFNNKPFCNYCKRTGHVKESCYAKKRQDQSGQGNSERRAQHQNPPVKNV